MYSRMKAKAWFFSLIFCGLAACGSEDDPISGQTNLTGKIYTQTFEGTPPGGSFGTYTRRLVFSVNSVEDSIEGVGEPQTFTYSVVNDFEVNVTIGPGEVKEYRLSEDLQTLTQLDDTDQVFTLQTTNLLVDIL